MGSDVGVSSSIAAASAVAGVAIVVLEEDGVAGGGLGLVERFLDFFVAGRRGQECESWPVALQRGQAFSEPGHDAMTLNPSKSKNGGAARGDPAFTFSTISQRLDCKGRPLYICGAIAITSPYADQCLRSCCSRTRDAKTGTFINLIGTKRDGVPAGGTGCTVKCLHTNGEERKSCCPS